MKRGTKELVEDIKRTLTARIIPNMPASVKGSHGASSGYGYIREFIKKKIDQFPFEWYLNEMKTTKEKP